MIKTNKQYKLFSNITSIFIVLLLTVFLFYVGADGYQGIAAAKFGIFRVICGGYIVLMLLLLLESIAVGTFKKDSFGGILKRMSIAQKLAAGYILLTWVSAILSPYFPETVWGVTRFEGAMTITIYGICFLLVSAFGEVSEKVLYVFGAAVSLFCVICILQLFGGNPLGLYPGGLTYFDAYKKYAGAYLGTIGNIDLVAAFFAMVIPLLWIGILRLNGKRRFLLFIPLGLGLFVSVKMFVLAGIVGLVVGGFLSLPVVLPCSRRKKKVLWGAVILTIAGMFGFVYLIDTGGGMLHEIHQILHGNFDNAFGSARMYIWKSVLAQVPSQLLFGAGPDTMAYADIVPFTDYLAELELTVMTHIDVAHNEYLNILYHQGLPALAVYLLLLGNLAMKWFRQSETNGVTAMLGGAALCYCVQAFFGFSILATAPFFWVILGLLDKITRKEGERLCGKN